MILALIFCFRFWLSILLPWRLSSSWYLLSSCICECRWLTLRSLCLRNCLWGTSLSCWRLHTMIPSCLPHCSRFNSRNIIYLSILRNIRFSWANFSFYFLISFFNTNLILLSIWYWKFTCCWLCWNILSCIDWWMCLSYTIRNFWLGNRINFWLIGFLNLNIFHFVINFFEFICIINCKHVLVFNFSLLFNQSFLLSLSLFSSFFFLLPF